MICAYLLHRDRYKDADEVLNFYGQARTFNAKVGLQQISCKFYKSEACTFHACAHRCNHTNSVLSSDRFGLL